MPPDIFEVKMNANGLNYLADMVFIEKSKCTPFPRGCACTPNLKDTLYAYVQTYWAHKKSLSIEFLKWYLAVSCLLT